MRVERHESRRSDHLLSWELHNVISFPVFVKFTQTEINQIYHVGLIIKADCNVVWLDVSMDHAVFVDVCKSLDKLETDCEGCRGRDLATTEVKEVLETRTQALHSNVSIRGCFTLTNETWNTDNILFF